MKKADAIKHYGTQRGLALAMGISAQAVGKWPEIVPELWAYKIAADSGGRLKVGKKDYDSY